MTTVYSVGHSIRSLDELTTLLAKYKLELLADVRRFPGSRKVPWFNKENLEKAPVNVGVAYIHIPELGGFRKGGYRAYTETEEFSRGLDKLMRLAESKRTAFMCAEKLFWRCHRRFIAEALCRQGVRVIHVIEIERTYQHKLKI